MSNDILYATVARGTTVLARYASCSGNFQEITDHILSKIGPSDDKMTYTQTGYLFHYIVQNRITYLCITEDGFDRSKSFAYLGEIVRRFTKTYQNRAGTALPYAMQSEFSRVLASEMRHFSKGDSGKMQRVQEDLSELKGIMINNIDSIAQRGEKLELLVEKTDDLSTSAMTFKKSSRTLERTMFMKNVKITVAIVCVILVFILIIVFASCGTNWSDCGKS